MSMSFGVPSILLVLLFAGFQARAVIGAAYQMQLGNPSSATTSTNDHFHYLIQRDVEALDYSDHYGEPLWASWDLTAADVGSATRSSIYFTDTNLPATFYRVTTTDYNGVGNIDFNRGHMCPSEDRTDTRQDNDAVFYMSNIIPQSGPNNQGVWANFESYCRALAATNELLITCGPSGFGTGQLPSGKAYIASNVWKIVIVVPQGNGSALSRLTTSNRVISISTPNVTNGLSSSWQTYITSARQIELATGLEFFTAVPSLTGAVYRAKMDGAPAPSIAAFSPANGAAGTTIGISGSNFSSASVAMFNGADAAFTIDSSTHITATVPAGATSGRLSVIAPGGLAISADSFTVNRTAPSLTMVLTSTNMVILSWPASAPGFVLQQTGDPAATDWVSVNRSVNLVGSYNQVILPTVEQKFFRLVSTPP